MSADPECPARGKECPGFGRKVRFRISCPKTNRRQLSDRTDPPHERVRLVHVNVDSDNKTEKKELRVMIQSNNSSASGERETKVLVEINGMKVLRCHQLWMLSHHRECKHLRIFDWQVGTIKDGTILRMLLVIGDKIHEKIHRREEIDVTKEVATD